MIPDEYINAVAQFPIRLRELIPIWTTSEPHSMQNSASPTPIWIVLADRENSLKHSNGPLHALVPR